MTTWLLLIFEPLIAAVDYLSNGLWWIYAQIDRALNYTLLKRKFKRVVGYWPDLTHPKTMNEKIQWRKLNDRASVYPVIADKFRLREYITHRFGAERAAEIMPNWRLITAKPRAATLRAAGTGVILKPNHGAGWQRVVPDASDPDWRRLAFTARRWMRKRYGVKRHEWFYSNIKAVTLVEDLVLGPDNQPPMDIKFHVMDGQCIWVLVVYDRKTDMRVVQASRDWQRIETTSRNYTHGALPDKPAYFQEILAIAEEIGCDFDYIRVDFLCGVSEWRLNELTLCESSGFVASNDVALALARGSRWNHRKYDGVWNNSAPYDR